MFFNTAIAHTWCAGLMIAAAHQGWEAYHLRFTISDQMCAGAACAMMSANHVVKRCVRPQFTHAVSLSSVHFGLHWLAQPLVHHEACWRWCSW